MPVVGQDLSHAQIHIHLCIHQVCIFIFWCFYLACFGPDTMSVRNRGAQNDEIGGGIVRKLLVEVLPQRRSLGVLHPLPGVLQNQRGNSSDGNVVYLITRLMRYDSIRIIIIVFFLVFFGGF